MTAEIITIGDEILIGQIVDSNSTFIASLLNKIGVSVIRITSIGDKGEEIENAIKHAEGSSDLILITGGLGPTKDDITKSTLAKYFNSDLEINKQALDNVMDIFRKSGRPLLDINKKQAEVPKNCTVLQNVLGTAPGMWFESNGKVIVSMPGVPSEMMEMMQNQVIPRLQSNYNMNTIVHKHILTAGIGESFIALKLSDLENSLPSYVKLAYLPAMDQVRLRLSGIGKDRDALEKELSYYVKCIENKVQKHIIAMDDISFEKAIVDKLIKKGKTISTAESCTGGYIASLITSVPNASKVYKGGFVAYANDVKVRELDIDEKILEKFGAVSRETAQEMARGAVTKFNTDYAIACTGIAGPSGASRDKPLGLIYICIASAEDTYAKEFRFGEDRNRNIKQTAANAFFMLWESINFEHL